MHRIWIRRYVLGALLVLAAWALFALVVAPELIRRGYAGRAPDIVNRIFTGQDAHPVAFYLDAWRSLLVRLTSLLSGLLLLIGWWTLLPRGRRRIVDYVLGGEPGLGPAALFRFAMLGGLLSGAGEAIYSVIRHAVFPQPAAGFYSEVVWMAPLSAMLAAAGVGLGVAAVAKGGANRVSVRNASFLFGAMGFYGVIQSPGIPLHPVAAAILSIGLAAALARVLHARRVAVARLARRSGPWLAFFTVTLAGYGLATTPRVSELRAMFRAPAPARRFPNVLLIILDTARADHFGLYGYPRQTSPQIDRWAQSGVVFERALSTSSWTLPAHSSMFTGLDNHVTDTGFDRPLARQFRTVAEVLADVGYATGGFVANPAYTTRASGLGQGFARYEDRPVDVVDFLASSWLAQRLIGRWFFAVTGRSPHTKSAPEVTDEFLSWLDRLNGDRPFFAFLNYIEAHEPYSAPDSWVRKFGPLPTTDWYKFKFDFRKEPGAPVDDREIDRWINRYDAGIAYIDHEIGRIHGRLEKTGLLQNTVVILTADHGEMWGEQSELGHASSLYLPLLHVPLVIWYPARLPGGKRIPETVGIRDIPRTLADLTGAKELATLPGASLVSSLDRERPPAPRPQLAELESYGGGVPWWAPVNAGSMKSVFIEGFQYIRYADGSEELFDIHSDPGEEVNLATSHERPGVLLRARTTLDSLALR